MKTLAKKKEQPEEVSGLVGSLISNLQEIDGLIFNEDVTTVPTELDGFNTIMGGGVPVGKLILLSGLAGGGKSSLSGAMVRAFQNYHPQAMAVYLDSEQGTSPSRLKNLGCDPSRIILVSQGLTLESVLDITKKTAEYKLKNDLVDVPFIIVLDSESETLTKKHFEVADPTKVIGYKANLESIVVPNIVQICQQYKISFVMICQLRDKIAMSMYQVSMGDGLKGLGDKKISGSNILKFAPYQIIFVRPKEELDKDVFGFSGVLSEIKFVKNKLYTPLIKLELVLNYKTGFNNFWSKYTLLQNSKEIKGTAWQYIDSLPEVKFRKKDAENLYNTNSDFKAAFDALYKKIEDLAFDADLVTIPEDELNVVINDDVSDKTSFEDAISGSTTIISDINQNL